MGKDRSIDAIWIVKMSTQDLGYEIVDSVTFPYGSEIKSSINVGWYPDTGLIMHINFTKIFYYCLKTNTIVDHRSKKLSEAIAKSKECFERKDYETAIGHFISFFLEHKI